MDEAFWKVNKGLVTLDAEENIFFTKRGREHYVPFLSKYGFQLENIKTVEQFKEAVANAQKEASAQAASYELDSLKKRLEDPRTSQAEKVVIRRLLRLPPERKTATVLKFPTGGTIIVQ